MFAGFKWYTHRLKLPPIPGITVTEIFLHSFSHPTHSSDFHSLDSDIQFTYFTLILPILKGNFIGIIDTEAVISLESKLSYAFVNLSWVQFHNPLIDSPLDLIEWIFVSIFQAKDFTRSHLQRCKGNFRLLINWLRNVPKCYFIAWFLKWRLSYGTA